MTLAVKQQMEDVMLLELSKSTRLLGVSRVDEPTIPTLLSAMHTYKNSLVALLWALPCLHLFQMSMLEKNHSIQVRMNQNGGCMDCYGGVQDSKSHHPKLNPVPANKVRWHGGLCQTNNNFVLHIYMPDVLIIIINSSLFRHT
jgi:hypothetical protein